jgi:D-3-phosphoglycerate dehydrogenase
MKKILIPTKLDTTAARLLTDNGAYEVVQDDKRDIAELVADHGDAYAIIVRSEKVTEQIIDALPSLKVVIRAGAGFDNIAHKYARTKGIDVMNTPGANSNAVAEEVVAMMLADARHIVPADISTREGKWEKKQFMGREIANKTVGIVGLGNIGQLLAKRLSGFNVTLLGFDPVISPERAADFNVDLVDLKELFSKSDYISLHIPQNDQTKGFVNADMLGLMKDGATIVNCARAGVINEDDLRDFKTKKGLRFLNDVYAKDAEGEKTVADIADLMLPHLGASTVEANMNAARRSAEQLIDFDSKGITSFIVNRDIPEGLDEAYCRLANTLARLCTRIVGDQTPLARIETTFYGDLEKYADWLLVPIVAGIWSDFDRSMDHKSAQDYLKEMGIEYVNRPVDTDKRYAGSITIDLLGEIGDTNLKRSSVRGTVAEGNLMVSRINSFDKLYFEPVGNTLCVYYPDRPGVVGAIGGKLAEAGMNIEDMRHSHDLKSNRSLAIMKVNHEVTPELVQIISDEVGAVTAFGIDL